MTPKKSSYARLKNWRQKKQEEYAGVIVGVPKKTTLNQAVRYPGLVIIMGDIRSGKTALAHEMANQFHRKHRLPAVVHMPRSSEKERRRIQKLIPSWMTVVSKRSQWPEKSLVIYDEAAQSAHSRRSQSGDAVNLDELLSISGQREQLIVFISHYSRKLDLNVCTACHRIIWKRPTYAHQLWEREEMADFTTKAYDFFRLVKGVKAQKKACLILDMDDFGFYQCNNNLPSWWSEDLSKLFKNTTEGGGQ